MQRRSFLRLLATAPAALAFPQIVKSQTLGLGGGITPSNRLNFAIIGAGSQGSGVMGGFLNIAETQMIAVCDVDRKYREKAKARVEQTYAQRMGTGDYKGCDTYVDYTELLARPDLDGVIIATPDHWHPLQVLAAARAGLHIYCEKPVANTIAECDAMVAAVERAGITCQIGNMQRSMAEFRRAISLARSGMLGRITSVKVGLPGGGSVSSATAPVAMPSPADFDYERWLGPVAHIPYRSLGKEFTHYNWRWYYDFAGGQLSDWICHHYDIAVLALGLEHEPVSELRNITATFPTVKTNLNAAANSYSFEAVYRGGQVISVSDKNPGGLRIEGTDGWVYVTRGRIEHSDNLRRATIPVEYQIYGTNTTSHQQNLVDCIRNGATPRAPIAEVARITLVSSLANAALRSGTTRLGWDAAAGTVTGAPEAERYLTSTYRAPYSLA